MIESRSFISAAIIVAAFSVILSSCVSADKTREQETAALFKSALKLYSSTNWVDRQNAVKKVNTFLYVVDQNVYYLNKNTRPYLQTAENFLLEASYDIQAAVRIEASIGLGMITSNGSMLRLIEMADGDRDANIKWVAIRALSKNAYPESADLFARAFNSEDWLIREAAITGLLAVESVEVKKKHIAVIERALADQSAAVRTAALVHLNFNDPRLYQAIALNLTGERKSFRHIKAALKAAAGYRLDETLRKKIISDYLTHDDVEIRLLALKVLKTEQMLPAPEK